MSITTIQEAGRLLGIELRSKSKHMVGTSIHSKSPNIITINIDSNEIREFLEQNYSTYKGYKTKIRLVHTPIWGRKNQ